MDRNTVTHDDVGHSEYNAGALRPVPPLLLGWYGRQARVLPWRSLPTPYRVWVSEVMLQQTRVETVLPYFERFIAALPDIPSLSCACESVLMKLWEGLGYYSRARNMQRAARILVERHGGELPADPELLMQLPGIGEYTAGAIASIAFGCPVEAVDGNVLRVLARLLDSHEEVTLPEVRQRFRALTRGMLPHDRPGDFNQALMDLGATVCLPNGAPRCPACPLTMHCGGHRAGRAEELPRKSQKKPRDIRKRTVFVLLCGGWALLARRPSAGLLAGLWELPGVDGWLDEDDAAGQLQRWGASAQPLRVLGDARHVFTHVEWHMRGYLAEVESFKPGWEHAWADGLALRRDYAVPSAFRPFSKYLP